MWRALIPYANQCIAPFIEQLAFSGVTGDLRNHFNNITNLFRHHDNHQQNVQCGRSEHDEVVIADLRPIHVLKTFICRPLQSYIIFVYFFKYFQLLTDI